MRLPFRSFSWWIVVAWAVASAGARAEEPVRVVMPGIQAHPGTPEGVAQVLGDLVLEALLNRQGLRATGPSDIRTLLAAEEQKRLLGCADEACMLSLAGKLGADWLVGGTLGRLEDQYVLSLVLLEAKEARVTARASITLGALKQAPELVGPLVDRLLGQRPRVRTPRALALPKPMEPRQAVELQEFRKRVAVYVENLKRGPYTAAMPAERRALLEDMLATELPEVFQRKHNTFFAVPGSAEAETKLQWRQATAPGPAEDARRRLAEWSELVDQLELLRGAYQRGLELEKNGTGARPAELPFAVKPVELQGPADLPAVRAYLDAYQEGSTVLGKALAAARDGRLEDFRQQHAPSAAQGAEVFLAELRRVQDQGFGLRVCPLFTLTNRDVEQNAQELAERGRLVVCRVKIKQDTASQDDVSLVRELGGYRITSW